MIRRGDVFEVAIALSGHPTSGGEHSSFAVSADAFNERSGLVIVLSSRRADSRVKPPYAFYIQDSGVYEHYAGRGVDFGRPITPTLAATFKGDAVAHRKMGHVSEGFFSGSACYRGFGAEDALRVQFQLPGRMESLAKLYASAARDVVAAFKHQVELRLSIWSVNGQANPWLIISNNTHNAKTGYVQALELTPDCQIYPETQLSRLDTTLSGGPYFIGPTLLSLRKAGSAAGEEVLGELLGKVQSSSAPVVDNHLMAVFGLIVSGWGDR